MTAAGSTFQLFDGLCAEKKKDLHLNLQQCQFKRCCTFSYVDMFFKRKKTKDEVKARKIYDKMRITGEFVSHEWTVKIFSCIPSIS